MTKAIVALTVGTSLIIGGAFAQQTAPSGIPMKGMGMEMMMPMPNDPPATAGYKKAMMTMMHNMPKFTGNADVDFMTQMRPHHQAAIEMAKVVLAHGKNDETKKLAQEIIEAQQKEISMIDEWLTKNAK